MKNGNEEQDSGALSNPLSFIRSGGYGYRDATLYARGSYGYFLLSYSSNKNGSGNLVFHVTYLNPQFSVEHGSGWAVRCKSVSKSFITLINTSYSMNNDGEARDSGVLSNPLLFLRSGALGWGNAGSSHRGGYGFYWSQRSVSDTSSDYLTFGNTYLFPQYNGYRGDGYAVRCVVASQILHHSH